MRVAAGLLCFLLIFLSPDKLLAQALYQLPPATFPVGTTPQGVAVADFAHTGYPGLVVTNKASNTMTLYLGAATGTFATPVTVRTCVGPSQLITADFNNDSYPDVAIVCRLPVKWKFS